MAAEARLGNSGARRAGAADGSRHLGKLARTEQVDRETFKQIFRDCWNAFKAFAPRYDTEYYDTVVHKMLDCGEPEKMGYVRYLCFNCGETRTIGFSCKSCFCLACGRVYADRWVDFIGRRLLPGVTYRHIVLTVPECLRLWFYRDPALLSPLIRCGNACLNDVFAAVSKTRLKIGTVIVLQTAGRPAKYNPHLHILVTAGGISAKDDRWVQVDDIPFKLLHRKWQYHLLSMLRCEVRNPAVERAIDHCWRNYPKGFVAYIQPGEVPSGGKGLAQYLAKYLVSPPISVRRIESYDGKSVRYWYRDHKTHKIEHVTLPVLRFVGRMVQHILPKGFQRIRYYGLHGHRCYDTIRAKLAVLTQTRQQSTPSAGYRVIPRKSFAQLFLQAFDSDPLLCPVCRSRMELECLWHPKRGKFRDYFYDHLGEPVHVKRPSDHPSGRHVDRGPVDVPQRMVSLPLPFM